MNTSLTFRDVFEWADDTGVLPQKYWDLWGDADSDTPVTDADTYLAEFFGFKNLEEMVKWEMLISVTTGRFNSDAGDPSEFMDIDTENDHEFPFDIWELVKAKSEDLAENNNPNNWFV